MDQRFYASSYGRFNTPDPARSAKLRNPLTWNRYSYVVGDPVNKHDPKGLCYTSPDGEVWEDGAWDTVAWDYGGTESYVEYSPGPCADFYSDSYPAYNLATDDGRVAYAQAVIAAVNYYNPGGLVDSFMAYSAAAALPSAAMVSVAGAYAAGATAADSIMLGTTGFVDQLTGLYYSGYVQIGGVVGAATLSMSPSQWLALGDDGQRAAMGGFIDAAIQRGSQIIFTFDPSLAAEGSGTAWEYEYLTNTLGWVIQQEGTSWVAAKP